MNLNVKINKENMYWVMLLFGAVIYGITRLNYVLYLSFILLVLNVIVNVIKYRPYDKLLIDLCFCALLLPDNYTIIAVAFMMAVQGLFEKKFNDKLSLWKVFFVFLCLNILLNLLLKDTFILNILFSVIYIFPFFIFGSYLKKLNENTKSEFIYSRLKWFLSIQLISTAVWALTHFQEVSSYNDMDWVTGTLGAYQCNVLMCICAFIGMVFLCHYTYFRQTKDLIWAFLSFGIVICTGAVLYTASLFGAFILILFNKDIASKTKAMIFLFIIAMALVFAVCLPDWIVGEMKKLLDTEYLLKRVVKLRYYYNTFIAIPKQEGVLRFLLGFGPGAFTSRAADTCAGGYVSLYDKIFPNWESDIRVLYVDSVAEMYYGEGLSSTPQASIISVTGEAGLIGLIFLLIFFIRKYKKANMFSKLALLFFFILMFVDNVLEFAKYGFALWTAYYLCIALAKNKKNRRAYGRAVPNTVNNNGLLQC